MLQGDENMDDSHAKFIVGILLGIAVVEVLLKLLGQ